MNGTETKEIKKEKPSLPDRGEYKTWTGFFGAMVKYYEYYNDAARIAKWTEKLEKSKAIKAADKAAGKPQKENYKEWTDFFQAMVDYYTEKGDKQQIWKWEEKLEKSKKIKEQKDSKPNRDNFETWVEFFEAMVKYQEKYARRQSDINFWIRKLENSREMAGWKKAS